MCAFAPLNLLVVFGAQLPQKPLGEADAGGKFSEACEEVEGTGAPSAPTAKLTSELGRPGKVSEGANAHHQRRRRPMAVPAADMMASFYVLSHGFYNPVQGSSVMNSTEHPECVAEGCKLQAPGDCFQHPSGKGAAPILPSLLSPPTPSASSSLLVHGEKVDVELQRMCQQAFPDMVMLPKTIVDLDMSYADDSWRRSKEVSKIILVLTRDNIAALAVIATLNVFGAIYLWKICTRRSCSCRLCRNQYRTVSLLGSGGYGSVYLVERLPDMERFVSKKILVREITEVDEYSLEAKELITLRHRHIVSYEEDFVHIEYGGLEPKTYFMIIMEYCPEGDLKEKIELDFLSFTEEWVRTVFAQLLQAVQYLHSKNVIHRDLKSQNVFLTYNGHVRLGDFGLCRHTPRVAGSATLTHAGTDCYMAPEMLSSSRYGKPADMWSLGCVLYELCTGQFMWELEGILGAMVMKDSHIVQKLVQKEIAPAVGQELKSLMKRLLSCNPANRPTATACIRKKLFKRGFPLSHQTFGESLGEPAGTPMAAEVGEEEDKDASTPTTEGKVSEETLGSDQEDGEMEEDEEASGEEARTLARCAFSEVAPRRRRKKGTKKGWRC